MGVTCQPGGSPLHFGAAFGGSLLCFEAAFGGGNPFCLWDWAGMRDPHNEAGLGL